MDYGYQYKLDDYNQNFLCFQARLLFEELKIIKKEDYKSWVKRGDLRKIGRAGGRGNYAWVSYYHIKKKWVQDAVKNFLGDPKNVFTINDLENYIEKDFDALRYFAKHTRPCGNHLTPEKQLAYATNASIFNAIKKVLNANSGLLKRKGRKGGISKDKAWQSISESVNHLAKLTYKDSDRLKYNFKLPKCHRALERKYNEYQKVNGYNYESLLDNRDGLKNRMKITKEIGDFLLATYCLPNKLTIPEVLDRYDLERAKNGKWKSLTNSAIYEWLEKPENKRIWYLARHGDEAYSNKYRRTNTIEKSNWFPNCYWCIDGSKLDWIHIWDDSANKLGAKLKLNVLFDVYSEKILGYDVSFTESHIEHFNTIKMAVNEAGCRPYLMTYDNQSGHKMERMQSLYDSLVAQKDENGENGGTHYPGAAKKHGNPAEGLFGRFQKQVLNKEWYSDKQSITVRRLDNKMNPDFIKANKSLIKSIEELIERLDTCVIIWNNRPKNRKTKVTRNEFYMHEMPMRQELSLFDVMDKMWIEEKKRRIEYTKDGLTFRLKDEKYEYEVYDKDGNIDTEFRRTNIGKKFIVRYDPSFLDGYIQLCEKNHDGNIIHIANAQPKRNTQPVPVLMKDGDKEQWQKDNAINDFEYKRDKKAYKDLMHLTGITPEALIEEQELMHKFKGDLSKVERSKLESEENLTSAASRL